MQQSAKWINKFAADTDFIADPGNIHINGWDAYRMLTRGLCSASKRSPTMMTKLDGTKCTNIKECLHVHLQHHDKLLNTLSNTDRSVLQLLPSFEPYLKFDLSPTTKEIRTALRALNDSTPGTTTVPAVAWKCLDLNASTRDLVVRSERAVVVATARLLVDVALRGCYPVGLAIGNALVRISY